MNKDIKFFNRLTKASIKRYARKKYANYMFIDDNYSRIFNEVVFSYYKFDPSKVIPKEGRLRNAETWAIYRGSWPIKTIISELNQKHKTISIDRVAEPYYEPEYEKEETKEEHTKLINFYIKNSGLPPSYKTYMYEALSGKSIQEIANKYNCTHQNIELALRNSYARIRKFHESPEF